MITDTLKKEIAAETLYSAGHGIAWQSLMQKKNLRFGFLGGSVTMGFAGNAVHEGAYPELTVAGLRERGYDAEGFICAEAGMSTMHGNLLADEQILCHKPDLVFLEFSINETTLRPSVISFESLLRKLLTAPDPPVVCIFTIRNYNDYQCESFMLPIAEHYGLPCVRLRAALNAALERGALKWADYGDTESHPNADGQALLAECLLHFFDTVRSMPDEAPAPLPEPWLGAPFTGLRFLRPAAGCPAVETEAPLVPRPHPYYENAWLLTPESGALTVTANCRALMLFYETHSLPEYGRCSVSADGAPFTPPVIDSNSIYGWGNARFAVIISEDASAEHTVRLEPESGSFYLLGIGICE